MTEDKLRGLIERADTLEKAETAEEWMERQRIPEGLKDRLLAELRGKIIRLMAEDARKAVR